MARPAMAFELVRYRQRLNEKYRVVNGGLLSGV